MNDPNQADHFYMLQREEIIMTMTTTAAPTPTPTKRPHSTKTYSPRYRPIVPTAGDALACAVCGQWTPPTEQHGVETIGSFGYEPRTYAERVLAQRNRGAIGKPFETRMTRCGECSARLDEAERLARKYPTAVVIGEYSIHGSAAVRAVEHVLAAAAAMSQELTVSRARDLHLAVEHLALVGRRLSWRARFGGAVAHGIESETAAAIPWGHLGESQRAETRRTFADYLAARIERPVPIHPNDAAACYLCGIDEVVMLPSRAATAWHSVTVSPSSLGGTYGSSRIDTEVCATCFEEFSEIGSWGGTLLDRLVLRAADIEGHPLAREIQFNGVTAWGTSGRTKPNREPFGHLALAQLADDIRAGRIN